ncbi:MAG: DNA-directed RNA polymerase subunit L [Candidatus Woesearchaeota archaeon]|jgi:DNA-directed RNA polymerase II subunit RPB11|nr:DNA-directed RNA polymerase subunit L [Candidatus Woesearchaeota archaeon]MDP7323273.1 DNA-directed RNA polymerase subunit L [Candidatus Woesearchaeota archaeon]MDP7458242.1 DNA-directed RNA polymerase subunit L [Candidatus Woesearchaeota archaeon]|tara:strand:+ start:472 stop:750 length:279 start_codon:yes stop_codon:yes gene_type:complete
MELNVLLEKKNKLIVQIKGGDNTICNALRQELWNDSHVKNAGYTIRHPLVGIPRLIVETGQGSDPKKALLAAAQRIKKTNEQIRKVVGKSVK